MAYIQSTFAEVISPILPEEFFRNYLGAEPLFVQGDPSRFASLFPWTALDDVLRHHRLAPPRIRLVRDGTALPESNFIRYNQNRHGERIPELDTAALINQLRNGATLVLDEVDRVYEPLAALARDFEYVFRERVQVNLYAGWAHARGFDVHWDKHDVFVLQVDGEKLWHLYGITLPHPLSSDQADCPYPGPHPVRQETLKPGCLLYLPRGYWHAAEALEGSSLHLTIGVPHRTGLDFAKWVVARLRKHELLRTDIPQMADQTVKSAFVDDIRRILSDALSGGAPVLDTYVTEHASQSAYRPGDSNLPWSITEFPDWFLSSATVRWTAACAVPMEVMDDGRVILCSNRRRYTFASAALPLLAALIGRESLHFAALKSVAGTGLENSTLRLFLTELAREGLVSVTGSDKPSPSNLSGSGST